jgi:hypothetical protein
MINFFEKYKYGNIKENYNDVGPTIWVELYWLFILFNFGLLFVFPHFLSVLLLYLFLNYGRVSIQVTLQRKESLLDTFLALVMFSSIVIVI